MLKLALALSLATLAPANAATLESFIAGGKCPELARIERERDTIKQRSPIALAAMSLWINSRQFADTLDACEYDASH